MTKEIVRLIVRLLMTSTSPGTSSAATSSMHSQLHVNLFSLVITSPVHYAPLFLKRMFSLGLFFFHSKWQDLAVGFKAVFTLLLSLIPPGWYVPLPLCLPVFLCLWPLRARWEPRDESQLSLGLVQRSRGASNVEHPVSLPHIHTHTSHSMRVIKDGT